MNTFFNEVYDIVRKIPRGKVLSYGRIAMMLGKPQGARAVGWAVPRMCPGRGWLRLMGLLRTAGLVNCGGRGLGMRALRFCRMGASI